MKRNTQGLFVLAFTGFLAISSQAQSTPAPSLTEEQILDKNIEALGGRTALENVKSVVKKGLRTRKGGSMTVNLNGQPVTGTTEKGQDTIESYWKAGKSLLALNPGTKNEMRSGLTEGISWTLFQGAVATGQVPRSANTGTSYFEPALNWRQRCAKVELKGIKKVGERQAYKLELTMKDGSQQNRYYDAETLLLLRIESLGELRPLSGTPTGTAVARADEFYSEYRDVAGVKFPFEVKSAESGTVTKYSEIQVNVELDDSIFQPPPTKKK